jgi:ubiquitin C-terminal hydrolase
MSIEAAVTQKYQESPIFQLQVTFAALELSKRRTFNPIKLVESLKLRASDQQDAQEFSKLFLSHLEKEFKRQDNPDLRTLIQRRFEGQQTYVTLCHGCQRRSELASNFYELELSLKVGPPACRDCRSLDLHAQPDATIEDRISSVLAPEVLNGDNQ